MKEKSRNKPINLYRDKRTFIPVFLMIPSLVVGLETGYPALPFCTYVLFGMSLDWWYFTHKKHKDSDLVREDQLQEAGQTPKQVDDLNAYLVWTRKVAFLASIILTPILLLWQWPDQKSLHLKWQEDLILSYAASIFSLVIMGVVTRRIVYSFKLNQVIQKSRQGHDDSQYPFLPEALRPHGALLWMGSSFFGFNPLRSTSRDSHSSPFSDDHSRPVFSHDIINPDSSNSFSNPSFTSDFTTPSFSDTSCSSSFSSPSFSND